MKSFANLIVIMSLLFGLSLNAQEKKSPSDAKSSEAKAAFKNVNADQFDKLRQEKNTVVLDVRTKSEFDAGHIKGALNIDWKSPGFEKKAADLDKSKTYLVHCQGGRRSAQACEKLGQLNFPKLFNLEGGLGAWEKAGKPVEKGK